MGLLDIFRGKKKKEAEKQDWINKLEPYKEQIGNYEKLLSQLNTIEDIELIKTNVNNSINKLEAVNKLTSKHSEEVVDRIMSEGYFLDMSEEQFDSAVDYKIATGTERTYRGLNNSIVLPYTYRTEEILKTKTKVLRSNFSKKKKNVERKVFIFENDKLVSIKTT